MKKYYKKNAFTLAEVLLTLSIIGIVAAITIPALLQDIQKMDTVAKVFKYQSVIQQAIKGYMAKNGISELRGTGLFTGNANHAGAWNALKGEFNLLKDCGTSTGTGECFVAGLMNKHLNGDNDVIYDNYNWGKGILSDGSLILIYDRTGDCSEDMSISHSEPLKSSCADIAIDINGRNGPSKHGIDVFDWHITNTGTVLPYGVLDDTYIGCDPLSSDITPGSNGAPGFGVGCTAKILKEGKVNY